MKMRRFYVLVPLLAGYVSFADSFLHVVHEPRQVPTVSSKTEGGWATCQWCAGKIRYERTYKWDPYDREWIETTKEIPDTCRKCKSKNTELERLRREEANLDRKIEVKKTKARVAAKRQLLRETKGDGG